MLSPKRECHRIVFDVKEKVIVAGVFVAKNVYDTSIPTNKVIIIIILILLLLSN